MTSVVLPGPMLGAAVEARQIDAYKYDAVGDQGAMFATQRLAGDAIGAFTLTLNNLVVGSAVQISTQAGAAVENRTAAGSTEVFSLTAYTAGSATNDLSIKVRKGTSSPYYRPFETLTSAFVGAQSIYVSQIPDE